MWNYIISKWKIVNRDSAWLPTWWGKMSEIVKSVDWGCLWRDKVLLLFFQYIGNLFNCIVFGDLFCFIFSLYFTAFLQTFLMRHYRRYCARIILLYTSIVSMLSNECAPQHSQTPFYTSNSGNSSSLPFSFFHWREAQTKLAFFPANQWGPVAHFIFITDSFTWLP